MIPQAHSQRTSTSLGPEVSLTCHFIFQERSYYVTSIFLHLLLPHGRPLWRERSPNNSSGLLRVGPKAAFSTRLRYGRLDTSPNRLLLVASDGREEQHLPAMLKNSQEAPGPLEQEVLLACGAN